MPSCAALSSIEMPFRLGDTRGLFPSLKEAKQIRSRRCLRLSGEPRVPALPKARAGKLPAVRWGKSSTDWKLGRAVGLSPRNRLQAGAGCSVKS